MLEVQTCQYGNFRNVCWTDITTGSPRLPCSKGTQRRRTPHQGCRSGKLSKWHIPRDDARKPRCVLFYYNAFYGTSDPQVDPTLNPIFSLCIAELTISRRSRGFRCRLCSRKRHPVFAACNRDELRHRRLRPSRSWPQHSRCKLFCFQHWPSWPSSTSIRATRTRVVYIVLGIVMETSQGAW